ncbi:MAG: cell wall-binding repeat-containing protein [Lachnospiraceae bacterium]|nr:cell wall-binding repeat-containing protein [Candidatus Equihabitans merdae]
MMRKPYSIFASLLLSTAMMATSVCAYDITPADTSAAASILENVADGDILSADEIDAIMQAEYQVDKAGSASENTLTGASAITEELNAASLSGRCGADLTWEYDEEEEILTIRGQGKMYPYTYNKEEDVSSAPWANLTVTGIIIEDGVTSIGHYAFAALHDLTEVLIPNSVTSIGEYAFINCSQLTSVSQIPDGVSSLTGTFSGCSNLEEAPAIPDTVASMDYTSSGCESLSAAPTLPQYLTSMYGTFNKCFALEDAPAIPATVADMRYAFSNCSSLAAMAPMAGAPAQMAWAYANCTSLSQIVNLPEGIININYLFYNCTNLPEGPALPDSIKQMAYTFYGCTSLERAPSVPVNANNINYAFYGCTALEGDVNITAHNLLYYQKCLGGLNPNQHLRINHTPENSKVVKEIVASMDIPTEESRSLITRLGGNTRIETSLLTADRDLLLRNYDGAKFSNMVLAASHTFPDALGGSALAIAIDAPIILVDQNDPSQAINYVVDHMSADGTVYILGGTAAVPDLVDNTLGSMGLKIERIAGNSRYDTNLKTIKATMDRTQTDSIYTLLVASGSGYADSLSASATGNPIMLVGDKLTDEQAEFLIDHDVYEVIILGGTSAVSEEVFNSISELIEPDGHNTKTSRLAGESRFETSKLIAERFYNYYGHETTMGLVYAWNFPDGLCAGPLVYRQLSGLLLVDNDNTKEAKEFCQAQNTNEVYIFGGSALISDETATNIVWGR